MQQNDLKKSFRILFSLALDDKENIDEITFNINKSYDYTRSKGNNAEIKKEKLKLLFGALIILVALTSFVILLVMTTIV